MAQSTFSLIVRKDTTSAEIAGFLQQAGEKVLRPGAGLRARQGVGAHGKQDGTVVLYVRNAAGARTLGDRVALFIDDVKAFFNAKEEYRLAAVTLLERAEFSKFEELGVTDEARLCTSLTSALNGKSLTLDNMRDAWRAAFPEERRIECLFYREKLRNEITAKKGLPAATQKNRQAPGQVVENGLSELFYLESLLSVSPDYLDRFARQHLLALFKHLGQAVTDDTLCDLKDTITSVLHVACQHMNAGFVPLASFADASESEVEHIRTSIKFARNWIKGCVAHPDRSDVLRYNHILALDYLACMILGTYQPESEESSHAQQLLQKIAEKKPGDNYRSIWVALEAKFVDWLRLGKPAYAFFAAKQADMQCHVSEAD